MRTNIDIDDDLLSEAMALAGLKSKKATVEHSLRMLVRLGRQEAAWAEMKGLGWDGDLDAMRLGRQVD